MSRRNSLQEDGVEASRGSIIDLCNALLANAAIIAEVARRGPKSVNADSLEILLHQTQQLLQLLARCIDAHPDLEKDHNTSVLLGACRELHKSAVLLQELVQGNDGHRRSSKGLSFNLWKKVKTTKVPVCGEEAKSVAQRFEIIQAECQAALDAILYSRDGRYQPMYRWLPKTLSQDDLQYSPPVAHETAVSYLLADKLPQRILIHGPSGSGKSTLLRQLQAAFYNTEHDLHAKLVRRFPGGIRSVDCGLRLSKRYETYLTDLKRVALVLAKALLPQEETDLKKLGIYELVSMIRGCIQANAVLVVFDNVWDADMFSPAGMAIFTGHQYGEQQKGMVLMASQFNIAPELNWHSPDTIVIPLAANSNSAACRILLQQLWMKSAGASKFPENLQTVAKKIVVECGASPLAIQVIAHMLQGSPKPRKWQDLLHELLQLCNQAQFRRQSLNTLDEEQLPRLIYVYQLAMSKLPRICQAVVQALAVFPSATWIPVAALVFVYMQGTGRNLSESCTVITAMSRAYFLNLDIPTGRFMSGKFCYHGVLSNFVALSSDLDAMSLPSRVTEQTCLALALAKIYAIPSCQQQATQVFLRSLTAENAVNWSHTSKPEFWEDKAWTQLLELTQHPILGQAATSVVVAASQDLVDAPSMGIALAQLFGNSISIFSAAAIFSDIVWHVADEDVIYAITDLLEQNQAIPRVVIKLRELLAYSDPPQMGGIRAESRFDARILSSKELQFRSESRSPYAQDVAVLAWALADLAQFSSINTVVKLRSEPMIESLKTYEQGIAIFAYTRLLDLLGLS